MAAENLVVVGGGAAGFFCAINAARLNPGLSVVILEKSPKLLSKVRVSGGGRCNVTHACGSITDMARNYPRGAGFLKKAFHHFFVDDTIRWFEERGVSLKTESDGRMFPVSDDSSAIINCFLQEARRYHVEVKLKSGIHSVRKENGRFLIDTDEGLITADAVCIATGGLSGNMMSGLINSLGHTLIPPVPSLFTFNIPDRNLNALMGITLPEAELRISSLKLSETGPLLITHWGLSGPAVLKLSAWGARELNQVNYHFSVTVNWLPSYHEQSMLQKLREVRFAKASSLIANHPPEPLPGRLWHFLIREAGIPMEMRWADLPAKEQNKLAALLCTSRYEAKGKTTFKEEFVTAGGVALSEVDVSTMESRLVSGLYFAGEIMDIDGVTGGFNFQSCWTTGMIAARAVAGQKTKE